VTALELIQLKESALASGMQHSLVPIWLSLVFSLHTHTHTHTHTHSLLCCRGPDR
jgi:hypothetical protein